MKMQTGGDMEELVRIVSAADGEIVGRTRLQKTAFLLELAGLGSGYEFKYKHYGPFSEELASAVDLAPLLFDFREDQKRSGWGGTYSVFTSGAPYKGDEGDPYRQLVSLAKRANPIALELAATAAYLASIGDADPWGETERRKPEKVTGGKLDQAKALYIRFKQLQLPQALPDI